MKASFLIKFTLLAVLFLPSFALQAGFRQAAVASAHPLATEAGLTILAQGGNAFDAAVAVSATLAVVEPQGSGLGGGGFWLLRRAKDGKTILLDGRETAPTAAAQYFDQNREPPNPLPLDGPLAAGIPGLPAALLHLAQHYGRLPLSLSLQPAISVAEEGFPVGQRYLAAVKARLGTLQTSPQAAAIFLQNGRVPELGFLLRQADLAQTLRGLAKQGRAGFYLGKTAQQLVEAVKANGGLFSLEDLANYRVIERQPTQGEYRGIKIYSSTPPASGGVVLLEMLNILSGFDYPNLDAVTQKHLVVEAAKRAYRDRDAYLGDPDFVDMPLARLTSLDYAAGLRTTLRLDQALPSSAFAQGADTSHQGPNTTHFCIKDQSGNLVAATLSINQAFGSGFVAGKTGVLLNNEMDDFASRPGQPNGYGLVGGFANRIEAGKRMLSSMTPTLLETPEQIALLGTPGGSRITTMVLLGLLEFAQGGTPEQWVSKPRYHHQFLPDVVEYEAGALSETEIQALQAKGHSLKLINPPYGDMQALLWNKRNGSVTAASDPRGEGRAVVKSGP